MNYREQFYNGEIEAKTLLDVIDKMEGEDKILRASYQMVCEERKALREEVAALREGHDKEWRRAGIAEENLKAALRARVVVVPERLSKFNERSSLDQGWNACLDELARLNGKVVSEDALRVLVGHATGEIKHLNNGLCPDDLEGHETRDPDCTVCRALIDAGKEVGDA